MDHAVPSAALDRPRHRSSLGRFHWSRWMGVAAAGLMALCLVLTRVFGWAAMAMGLLLLTGWAAWQTRRGSQVDAACTCPPDAVVSGRRVVRVARHLQPLEDHPAARASVRVCPVTSTRWLSYRADSRDSGRPVRRLVRV